MENKKRGEIEEGKSMRGRGRGEKGGYYKEEGYRGREERRKRKAKRQQYSENEEREIEQEKEIQGRRVGGEKEEGR